MTAEAPSPGTLLPTDAPIVVFDGYCGLCSRTVQFVLKHEKSGRIQFLPAQSAPGTALYRQLGLDAESYETFILLDAGRPLFMSDAALRLVQLIGPPWSFLATTRILPRGLRDSVYRWVARNRMRFFGRTEACFLPGPEHRGRFLA